MTRLSPNFTLAELTRSQTAARLGLDNTPTPAVVAALAALCVHVLEPLRARVGGPLVINSGYRSPAVNKRIGGAATSQHALGEAADIERPGMSNFDLATVIRDSGMPFDHFDFELPVLRPFVSGPVFLETTVLSSCFRSVVGCQFLSVIWGFGPSVSHSLFHVAELSFSP